MVQQWEYLFVSILPTYTKRVARLIVNGCVRDYPPDKRPTLQEYFAELAAECWERVGCEGAYLHVFKRRVHAPGQPCYSPGGQVAC